MTRNARIALLLAAVLVAVVAAVVLGTGGEDDDSARPPAPTAAPGTATGPPARPSPRPVPTVRLRDGRPVGGVRTLEFAGGERIRFAVASNTEQAIHVHGYEVERTVRAGGRTTFSFPAGPQGVFEIESHTTGRAIASLRVVP